MFAAFRNLYKIHTTKRGNVVAILAAGSDAEAVEIYHSSGGTVAEVEAARESNGYPAPILKIYQ